MTELAYKQSGVVSKKEWFANSDACEFCKALDGSIISVGSTYIPKGGQLIGTDGGTRIMDYEDVKHPPAHSNCRCGLLPVIDES